MGDVVNKEVKFEEAENMKSGKLWENMNFDVLFFILMQLSFVDYLAVRGVCKPWRSLAIERMNRFMLCQPPLIVTLPSRAKKSCSFLNIFDGRSYTTKTSDLVSKSSYGFSGGFLVFICKCNDGGFLLVNPITGESFEIPMPYLRDPFYSLLRLRPRFRVLVTHSEDFGFFSVVVGARSKIFMVCRLSDISWTWYEQPHEIMDLVVFCGIIYFLTSDARIGVLKLFPTPTVQLLGVNKPPSLSGTGSALQLVASREHLFMVDISYQRKIKIYRFHSETMIWVQTESLGDYALFLGNFNCSGAINSAMWGGRSNCIYILEDAVTQCSIRSFDGVLIEKLKIIKRGYVHVEPHVWYFPMLEKNELH